VEGRDRVTPFVDLVVESLNLMHPRFARANGADSFRLEFYHAFRRLWDKALPVKLGLGHVMLHEVAAGGLGFVRLGESGQPDAPLGAVLFGEASPLAGYPHVVRVGVGTAPAPAEGETAVAFDTERWAARVL
jgi:hypothetical protein